MAKIDDLLTGSDIRKLQAPAKGNAITYEGGEGSVPGFGIRVTAAGARAFIFNYRTRSGRERRYTIGGWPDWTVTDARKEARRLRRLVDEGGDPLADLEAEREAPTVSDLIARFESEHLTRRCRASTARDYRSALDKYIKPHFKNMKVADVTSEDCDRLHHKISAAGYRHRANTIAAIMSRLFNLAIRWHMRADGTNPAKGIERNPETKRKRYLSGDELERLVAALAKYPDKRSADVVRLLLFTGARRGEVLGMRWADLDLTAGIWTKPGSSTKTKVDHVVPLSAPVQQLLSGIQEQQTAKRQALGEYVFPGNGSARHIVEIQRTWRRLCKAAKISGLRIHDLRHSFASQLASGGASLPLIGALLGHTQAQTTHRYAHLFQDPQKAAVERVAAIITAAAGPPAAPPTPLIRRGRHGR
jgi:integrase